MISHKYKCIFVHIPKTAGTSIENVLRDENPPVYNSLHNTASTYIKKYERYFDNYFKFSVVRNPWDRLVSGYFYHRALGYGSHKDRYGKSFKEFVQKIETFPQRHFLVGQYNYINIKGVDVLDYLIKFESLEEGFCEVSKKLNFKIKTLYDVRKTEHKHYTEYYNDETKQIVAEKYAKDIEYFGYEFGE